MLKKTSTIRLFEVNVQLISIRSFKKIIENLPKPSAPGNEEDMNSTSQERLYSFNKGDIIN